jgi:hypothetical protein
MMNVYMENYKKSNSADDARVHCYKLPAEGLEHLHKLRHSRRCRLGFFSRSSFELLLDVANEDCQTTCSASGRSNGRDG